MGLTNENVGPKILAKIKIYVLTRAELLFTLCYETPCTTIHSVISNFFIILKLFTNSRLFTIYDVHKLAIGNRSLLLGCS